MRRRASAAPRLLHRRRLFRSSADPAPEPEITGTETLRRRVWSRWKRSNLAGLSRDRQISLPALEAFAQGGPLPESALRALVAEFYPHNAVFDPVTDKLIDTSPPATLGLSGAVSQSERGRGASYRRLPGRARGRVAVRAGAVEAAGDARPEPAGAPRLRGQVMWRLSSPEAFIFLALLLMATVLAMG